MTGYGVRYRTSPNGAWTTVTPDVPAGTLTKVVTGLTANTAYTFEVVALGAEGNSTPVTANATTAELAPVAPTNLVTNSPAPTTTTITLNWSWTQGAGGPATGYKVRSRTTAGPGAWSGYQSVTPSSTKTKAITGLTTATSYDFEVVATGPGGDSAALSGSATTA